MFLAYAATIEGEMTYCAEDQSAILVTVSDELNIMIPASTTMPARYVDILFNRIEAATLERLENESQLSPSVMRSVEAVVVWLNTSSVKTFYLNADERSASSINLAFTSTHDAIALKKCLEERKISNANFSVSQSGLIDISQSALEKIEQREASRKEETLVDFDVDAASQLNTSVSQDLATSVAQIALPEMDPIRSNVQNSFLHWPLKPSADRLHGRTLNKVVSTEKIANSANHAQGHAINSPIPSLYLEDDLECGRDISPGWRNGVAWIATAPEPQATTAHDAEGDPFTRPQTPVQLQPPDQEDEFGCLYNATPRGVEKSSWTNQTVLQLGSMQKSISNIALHVPSRSSLNSPAAKIAQRMKNHEGELSGRLPMADKIGNDNATEMGKNASAKKSQMTLKSPYCRKNGNLKFGRKPKFWGDHGYGPKFEKGMIQNGFDFLQSSLDVKNDPSHDSGESLSGKGSIVTRSNIKDPLIPPPRSPSHKKSKPLTRPTHLVNRHKLPTKVKSSRGSKKDGVQRKTADRSSEDDVYADDDAKDQELRFRGKKPPSSKRKTKVSAKRAMNKDDQAYSIKKGLFGTTQKRKTKPQNTNMSVAQRKSKRTAALSATEKIKGLAESNAGESEKQIQTLNIQQGIQTLLHQQNGALSNIEAGPQMPFGPEELHCNGSTNLTSLNATRASEKDRKADRLKDVKLIEYQPQPPLVALDDGLYQLSTAKKLESSSASGRKGNHGDSGQPNINHNLQPRPANCVEDTARENQSPEQSVIGDKNLSVAESDAASPSLSNIGKLEVTTLGFDPLGVLDSPDNIFDKDATPWHPGNDICSSEGHFQNKVPVVPMVTTIVTLGGPRDDRNSKTADGETPASVLKPIQKVPFAVKLKNALTSNHLHGESTASNFKVSVQSPRNVLVAMSVNTETNNTANTPEKQCLESLALSEKFAQDVRMEGVGEEGISKPQVPGLNSNITTPNQSFLIKSGHRSRSWISSENSELVEVIDISSVSDDPISIKCLDNEDVVCNISEQLTHRPHFVKPSPDEPSPMISQLDQGCINKGRRKAVEFEGIRRDLHPRSISQQRSIGTSKFDTKSERKPCESKAEPIFAQNQTPTRAPLDINRKCNLISFNSHGPRNQGKVLCRKDIPSKSSQGTESCPLPNSVNENLKRKLSFKDEGRPLVDRFTKRRRTSNELNVAQDSASRIIPRQSSSVLKEDMHLPSSQSRRVDKNGSPMPFDRTCNVDLQSTENGVSRKASDRLPLVTNGSDEDTDISSLNNHLYDSGQLILPEQSPSVAKHVRVMASSSSKGCPNLSVSEISSASELTAHRMHPGGRLVNMLTDNVVKPIRPSDPFIADEKMRSNSFLDLLRKSGSVYNNDQKANHLSKAGVDTDKTLVEADLLSEDGPTSIGHSVKASRYSTESQDQFSPGPSSSEGVSHEKHLRRQALKPHQKGTLNVLFEISKVSRCSVNSYTKSKAE